METNPASNDQKGKHNRHRFTRNRYDIRSAKQAFGRKVWDYNRVSIHRNTKGEEMTVYIKTPIWGTQSVGVAKSKILRNEQLVVKIEYLDKNGNELYPFFLVMSGTKALKYPSQFVKGTELKIIPIDDFTRMRLKDKTKQEKLI